MFSYNNLRFRYEPFPIAIVRPVLPDDVYRALVASFPPQELFCHLSGVGHKFSFSERSDGKAYDKFIQEHPPWREIHRWLKGEGFVKKLLETLKSHHIDLGYKAARLSTRFEFSMLPADGGYILPHTDGRTKLVTIVVSMCGEREWEPAFGGGTDVNHPKDVRFMFNWANAQATFDDMEVLETFEFMPNQAVLFIKTFNSWHSVRPMTGTGSSLMRKTLTINIEI